MPTTPPPDKKQEQASYSTDPVGPDLTKDELLSVILSQQKTPMEDVCAAIHKWVTRPEPVDSR